MASSIANCDRPSIGLIATVTALAARYLAPRHLRAAQLLLAESDGESSAAVALRVGQARQRQQQRQGMANAAIEAGQIDALCALDDAAARFAHSAAQRLGWSGRGLHRALKVARSIADLAGAERISTAHVAEALQYRRALLGS